MMRESVGQVLEPIYRERQQWQKLVDLLSLKVEQEGDPFTQVELLRDIARISETELRDWGKAIESYGRIFAQVPEDENIRNALSRLGERLKSVKICRNLAKKPGEVIWGYLWGHFWRLAAQGIDS